MPLLSSCHQYGVITVIVIYLKTIVEIIEIFISEHTCIYTAEHRLLREKFLDLYKHYMQ